MEELSDIYGIDVKVLRMIYNILNTKYLDKEDLTISYIVEMYKNGFSYQEIGNIKGISKMGIRYHLKENFSSKEISTMKYLNSTRRKEIKDLIFRKEVVLKITPENSEEIRGILGYSPSYFKLIVANSDRKYRGGKYER